MSFNSVQTLLDSLVARLGRLEDWEPTMLANEIQSWARSKLPLEVSQLIVNSPANDAAIYVRGALPGGTAIQITGGGDDLGSIGVDGQPSEPATPEQSSASACYPGFITAHLGGNVYEVEIYKNGITLPAETVSVTQLQIASTATIRADGTVGVLVSKTDNGLYYMQVPVIQRSA